MNIPEHIETYLGAISRGFSLKGEAAEIQVVSIRDQPENGVVTYSTLGMSNFELPMPNQRMVRQELIFTARENYEPEKVASFLLTFSKHVAMQKRALLRGDVVGPSDPIIPGASLTSIYCTGPTVFDSRLATYYGSSPATVFVWLIPITSQEASFVRVKGWSRFEDVLETNSPVFWNLDRQSLAAIGEAPEDN